MEDRRKAGFHPALSFLVFVPVVNVVMIYVFAFSEWPVLKREGDQSSGMCEQPKLRSRRPRAIRILRVIFGLCLIVALACDTGTQFSGSPAFAVYRLKDQNLTASQIWNESLDSLILSDTPFLALNDLRSYRWQTHQFTVSASVDTQLSILRRTNGPVGGIPFVVTAGKDRIYLGAFWYAYSSLVPQVPYIEVISDPHRIQKSWNTQEQLDKRNDPRIYDALKASGVLIE